MNEKYYYLFSLVFIFVIPAIIAGIFVWDTIFLTNLILFVLGITIIGSVWDIWATRHGDKDPLWLWQFNHKETIGISFFGLPIEEYVFYVASSVYVVFVWEGIKLALNTENLMMYVLIPLLGLWTLVGILIPYKYGAKKGDILK